MDTLPIDRVVYKNVILHYLKCVRSRYIIRSLSDQCTDSKSQRQQVVTNSHNVRFQKARDDMIKTRSVNKELEFVSKGTEILLVKFVLEHFSAL